MTAGYFLSRVPPAQSTDGIGSFWRDSQDYRAFQQVGMTYPELLAGQFDSKRLTFHINLSLLAAIVGDSPRTTRGLVAPEDYDLSGGNTALVQPWVVEVPGLFGPSYSPLAIGPSLGEFLDDPLGDNESLGLTLPVLDQDVTFTGGWLRPPTDDLGSVFHGATDFSILTEWGQPRPLIEVCAAASGTVIMFLKHKSDGNRGVILQHERASGAKFRTLYQHVDATSIDVAIGDTVHAGQRLGRIVRRTDAETGADTSHLHFAVAVPHDGRINGRDTGVLWYLIDPFGVYNYHEPDAGPDYVYVPRAPGGLSSRIHGAERTVHWAGDPPIHALAGEIRTPYRRIIRMQARIRDRTAPSEPVSERDQFLVWLEGLESFFFVGLGTSLDRPIEQQMVALLRRGHATGRKVSLGYRFTRSERQISAVWMSQ